jgi:hypothetical protein
MLTSKWLTRVTTSGLCVTSAKHPFPLVDSTLTAFNVPILLSANAVIVKTRLTRISFQSKK